MGSRLNGQRIRSGTYVVGSLTSTYELGRFTVPADDYANAVYNCVAAEGSTPPQYARISSNADGSRSADGFMAWQWRISYLPFAQLTTFYTNTGLTGVWSSLVTVMDYDDQNNAIYLNATILRPQLPSGDGGVAPGGYQNIIFRFVKGTVIT